MNKFFAVMIVMFCSSLVWGRVRTIGSWPAEGQNTATNLGVNLPGYFEPSGCVYREGYVWAVGDNGYLAQLDLAGAVVGFWTVSGDLEGLTYAAEGNSKFYVGVENYPTIKEWPGTRSWPLAEMAVGGTNDRLEALAFLPDQYCDLLAYNGGAGSVFGSGGLFLAGHQGNGKIYVYDIDINGSSVIFAGEYGPYGRVDLAGLEANRSGGQVYAVWDSAGVVGRLSRGLELEAEWYVPAGSDNEEGICPVGCDAMVITEDPESTHHVWLYEGFPIDCKGNITVAVELEGVYTDVVREVRFVLTDCETGLAEERVEAVSFIEGVGVVVLEGVDGDADWISAVEGHTLRRLLPIVWDGVEAQVLFTGGTRLLSGDFSNPPWVMQDGLVDIQDFAILCIYWNQPIDPTWGYRADATADGIQDVADFSCIQVNFGKVSEPVSGCSSEVLIPAKFLNVEEKTYTKTP